MTQLIRTLSVISAFIVVLGAWPNTVLAQRLASASAPATERAIVTHLLVKLRADDRASLDAVLADIGTRI